MQTGYSTNLIVHAFAHSARQVDIDTDLTRPFFASMRADLSATEHDDESFATYVYGSAEVVGLMCLKAFIHQRDYTPDQHQQMVSGARALGAAFQKVNFLRDLAVDFEALGRSYFPGVTPDSMDEATKNRLLDDIESDLDESARALPLLPGRSKKAVALAQALFDELGVRLRATPAEKLLAQRVSVPTSRKAQLALKVWSGWLPSPRNG
jgi:Phytoene/squalene synthetase